MMGLEEQLEKQLLSRIKNLYPGFSTLGASSVYLPGDIAISGDGYLTQSGAGSALGIYNATASGTGNSNINYKWSYNFR